jgi:hypothetical protein
MLIRILILCAAILLISLLLRLNRRLEGAPPWLRIAYHIVFYGALAFVAAFAATFIGLHVFGYRL